MSGHVDRDENVGVSRNKTEHSVALRKELRCRKADVKCNN